jgi:hypothetical protein
MEVSSQIHAPAAFPPPPPAKSPQHPLDRGLNGGQSRSGRGAEEKKSLPLPGIELWSSSP